MSRPAQTGECNVCGRRFRLKADDTIRHHSDKRKSTDGLPVVAAV